MKFKFCFHLSKVVQSTQLTSLWMFAALYQHRVAISIAQELRWTITTSIFFSMIRYHITSCRVWEHPFKRIDSVNCLLWHKIARNATAEERKSKSVLCKSCKRLCCDLEHQRRSDVSASKHEARLLPSSNFKLKYLSPQSVSKRKEATLRERSHDKAMIAKLSPDMVLEDDQSDEVATILETIEEKASDELENVFKEADGRSVGTAVHNAWETDKRNAKAIFNKDQ